MNKHDAGTIGLAAHALVEWFTENLARVVATSAVIWFAVFFVHWRFGIRAHSDMSQTGFAAVGAAIAATMAAGLAGTALWFQYQKHKANTRHAWEMLQLNHNIRNAMQVIAYSQARMPQAEAEKVNHALNRISETLRMISNSANSPLPQLHHRPASRTSSIQTLQHAMRQPHIPLIAAKAHPKIAKNT